MARLPEIRTQSVFNPIPERVETTEGSGFAALAATFATIAKVTAPLGIQAAAAKGAEAVIRDANGNLVADTRIPFTPIDEAYNAAAASIYVTEMDGDVSSRIAAMQEQHYNDAAGFQNAVKAYRSEVMKTVPTVFKGDVANLITQRAGVVNNQIIRENYRETRERAANANTALIERITAENERLAADPTPENMAAIAANNVKLDEALTIRQGVPGLYYTPEQAQLAKEQHAAKIKTTLDTAVNSEVDAAEALLAIGEVPPNLDRARELAQGTPRQDALESLVTAQQKYPTFAAKTPEERAGIIADLRQGGVTPDEARLIGALETQDARIKEAVEKDPLGFSAKIGDTPPALDPSNPQSYANRLKFADRKLTEGNNPKGAVLTAAEAASIKTILKDGSPEQVVQTIQGLTQFGPYAGNAFQQVGLDAKMTGIVDLVMGGADPAIAASAVGGSRLGKEKRGLDDGDRVSGINTVMGRYDAAIGRPAPEKRAATVQTADPIYADLVENQGEPEGRDTWVKALNMALGEKDGVGGVVDFSPPVDYVPLGETLTTRKMVALPPDVNQAAAVGGWNRILNEYDAAIRSVAGYDLRGVAVTDEGQRKAETAVALATSTAASRFSEVGYSGGFPTYQGKFPDYDLLEDVQIRQVGSDKYALVYEGVALADSANPDRPFLFSMRRMSGSK